MRAAIVVAAAFAFLALAGCADSIESKRSQRDPALRRGPLQEMPVAFDPNWPEIAIPSGPDHNHQEFSQHVGRSTPNFQVLGHEPLVTDWFGATAGDYRCADVKTDGERRIAVTHSWGTDVAFVVADVTDVHAPRKIGELVMDRTQVHDLTLTPDLGYVLLATTPLDSGPENPVPSQSVRTAEFRDACSGRTTPILGPESGLPWASGIVLVDIQNPRNPIIVDFRPLPVLGAHSVGAWLIDGRTIVLASVLNYAHHASYYLFFEIVATPAGPRLEVLSVYAYVPPDTSVAPYQAPAAGVHDGYLAVHPVTGRWTAYLAYGPVGLVLLDVQDPRNPVFLSQWDDWAEPLGDASPPNPFVHSVWPLAGTWDGRHYTFLGEECHAHRPAMASCLVYTLDTTDPAKPVFVGAWTLPIDVPWTTTLEFSTHYLTVVNRTLFVSVYHGGLWAIDVSTTDGLRFMPSVGAFIPDLESPKPVGKIRRTLVAGGDGSALDDAPLVNDVLPTENGELIVFDSHSGLYTLRFDASRPAPAPPPWPLRYNES